MLQLQNITKQFRSESGAVITALERLDLNIEKGSFITVVGSNGSGKSTLLNLISGSDTPDSGSILLDGIDVTRMSEHKRARFIGRVFQDPYRGSFGDMTFEENLAVAARRGQGRGMRIACSRSLREEMRNRLSKLGAGLEHQLQQRVSTVSGGQRQLLTLAMATWQRPLLLLLDEHTAALDPKNAAIVMKMTSAVASDSEMSVIMVTHSMKQAARYGDRLLMLHRGRIVLDVRGREKHRIEASELFERFEQLRSMDSMDESIASMLRRQYV